MLSAGRDNLVNLILCKIKAVEKAGEKG